MKLCNRQRQCISIHAACCRKNIQLIILQKSSIGTHNPSSNLTVCPFLLHFGAFIHAHPHVFVLIQTCVYAFLNGMKTFERNIMNLLPKRIATSSTVLHFAHYSEQDTTLQSCCSSVAWCEKRLQRKSPPQASVSYLIYNEDSSLFRRWMPPSLFTSKLTQGIQMFSFAFANVSKSEQPHTVQMCSTLPHMLAILHQEHVL